MPDADLQPVLKPLVANRKRQLTEERTPGITEAEEQLIREELEKEILAEKRAKAAKTAAMRGTTDTSVLFTISIPNAAEKSKKFEELIKE